MPIFCCCASVQIIRRIVWIGPALTVIGEDRRMSHCWGSDIVASDFWVVIKLSIFLSRNLCRIFWFKNTKFGAANPTF